MTIPKNKILFILHYPPPIHGAAIVGKYIIESKLIKRNFDIRYLNLSMANSLNEIGKSSLLKLAKYLTLIFKTISTIIKFKPQLVYITMTAKGNGFFKDAIIVLIVKMFGGEIIYHFHNKGVSTRQEVWFENLLYKLVFKNTDVILLSNNLYADIKKYVNTDRVHICYNGFPKINIEKYNTKSESNKDDVQLLFLSNMMEAKGIYVLLEACKLLKERMIQFKCSIIGAEKDVSQIDLQARIKKLGVENYIQYLGPKYDNEKNNYLAKADIFVFPSFDECFPLVLIEAMQFSLPIISTDDGGIRDIIVEGDNGFLVKKGDASILAKKLEELIKDKTLRKKMGKMSRKRYLNSFTLNEFEKRFNNILSEIINKGNN